MADDGFNTDSEDELPHGWEERVSIDGRVFYACHQTQKTQWTHPVSNKRKKITGELPYGWEKKIGDSGYVYYIDHVNHKTTFTDPRLAFAVEDKDIVGDMSSIKQKFDAYSTAQQVLTGRDLTGKYAIITGANAGIGFETARSLALAGCTVTMACRNVVAAQACADTIVQEQSAAKVHVMKINLASLKSVREFALEYIRKNWPLHMLILNAGVLSPPHTVTEDGLELSYQVNCLSHHYLCRLLERILIRSAPSRIVNVASESHRHPGGTVQSVGDVTLDNLSPSADKYNALAHYGLTKLCNIAFSNAINQRKVLHKVCSNSLHPGSLMYTSLGRNWWGYRLLFSLLRPFTKSMGAATTIYAATCKELEDVGGMYFNNCWVCDPAALVQNGEFCDKVYQLGEQTILDKMGPDAFDTDISGKDTSVLFTRVGDGPSTPENSDLPSAAL